MSPQPGPVVNLLLIALLGLVGYLVGSLTKPTERGRQSISVQKSIVSATSGAGDFGADTRRFAAAATLGLAELEALFLAYGAGSRDLALLAAEVMEKWAVADALAALRDGVPRCAARVPEVLPRSFAAIAKQKQVPAAVVFKSFPIPPLRGECAAAAAFAWGAGENEEVLAMARELSRQDRTRFVREWHRGAPETSSPVLVDVDDRAAASLGRLLALASKDPASALRSGRAHDEFAEIAAAAFTAWVPRDSPAAWKAAEAFTSHARLASMTAALVRAESRRRALSDVLPEVQTLISRLHPEGPPEEVLVALFPILASERTQQALKYLNSLPRGTPVRGAASVILFDILSATDPAAAWRFSEGLVEEDGAKDHRALNPWLGPEAQRAAGAAKRWEAGFPCAADVASLLGNWMRHDPAEALAEFVRPGVSEAFQSAAIEAAVSPYGGAFSAEMLAKWISTLPPSTQVNLEPVVTKLIGGTRGKTPQGPGSEKR